MGQKTQAGAQQAAQGAGLVQQSTHKVRDGVQSISTQLDTARQQLLGFLGIQLGAGAVKDVIGLADAYKNLQSRIGLVTGEGEHLAQTMDDVQAVALRTHSALESTGVLFTRLAQAGKDAGLGLEQATAQSLALTESINQAVAISGAGVAASDAAITQLIQGLQSGVLRGEEFNSVMEQAPRLARALADGLGVTTGELRKMAESGALTTDVVIQSLQSQGQALEAEFGKLPLTVGRAITDVQTAFMRYVADTDAANGVTEKIAASISFVGENLESLADTLTIAGKGWLAFKAYNMSQTWLDKAKAIAAAKLAVQEEVAATTASTAATAANTGAKVANAAATKTQVAASGAQAAAIAVETAATVANTAAKGEAANVSGLFGRGVSLAAGAVRGLVGLLGGPVGAIVTLAMFSGEIKKGITAVVEWGAGFTAAGRQMKASTAALAEMERQEKINAELRRQQAQEDAARAAKAQQAIAAQFDLSKAAQAATAEFAKLTKEGKTAAQAVADIAKGFDTTTQQGLRDFGTTLNKVAADGKLSADQLKAAWGQILKTEDLQLFQLQAQQVFAGTAQGAQIMAQITEATVSQALQRTGLSFGAITGGMGEAARSAINDVQTIAGSLDLLTQQGVDTGAALTASIGKAIDTADSQKAIEAVRGQIEQLRSQLGDKITDGLLQQAEQKARDLKKAMDDATPGIQSVEEAMRKLGVTSSAALKESAEQSRAAYDVIRESGTASARDVREAFLKAAQAAIDAADGIAPAWVRAEAAQRGYVVQVDESGKSVIKLASEINNAAAATGNLQGAWQGVGAAIDSAAAKAKQLGTDGEEIKDQIGAANGGSFSAQAYAQQAKDVQELDAWWEQWSADYARKNAKLGGTSISMSRYWFEVQKAQYENARRDIQMQERIQQSAAVRRGNAGTGAAGQPGGSGGGATYVSNITLPGGGGTRQLRFADANSQSAAEQLLRDLAQAKGAAS
nr:tape measure protein [Comamonas denitrificans]